MLTGENGILTQATNAKEKTDKATEEEKIQMAVLGSSLDNNGYVDILEETSFKQELANQFGSQELDVHPNGDGSFIITVEDTQRKYYVNDDKTVINSDNIIEINNAEELASFRDEVNNGNSYEGKAVLLTSDITLSGEWEPIGFCDKSTNARYPDTEINTPFRGIFDGCKHTINSLKVENTQNMYQGLFGFAVNASIRNITIGTNSEIKGLYGAGIIGYLYGIKGNVYNCINNANTSSAGIIRTLAGNHIVANCRNYGNVTCSTTSTGGIVGGSNGGEWTEFKNYTQKIINCVNYGTITRQGGDNCGGIVGFFYGEILNCCNKGGVVNNSYYSGGIVGSIEGNVENCYNIGNVSGEESVGGIVGASLGKDNIINCYSFGQIIGNKNNGEIIGLKGTNSKMNNCYTKNDTFTAEDLGDAYVDNPENVNQPLLYWEVEENN